MNSKKEKYMINTVWAVGIFVLWELIAFLLDGVLQDPMAEAKLPYPHMVIISLMQNFSDLMSAAVLLFQEQSWDLHLVH